MHSEQSKVTVLAHQIEIRITPLAPISDIRLDPLLHPFPDSCLDVPFFPGEKMINGKQFKWSSSTHQLLSIPPGKLMLTSFSPAFSISSSLSSTCSAAAPNGTKLSW